MRFDAKTDVWALGILIIEATLLTPIEEHVCCVDRKFILNCLHSLY